MLQILKKKYLTGKCDSFTFRFTFTGCRSHLFLTEISYVFLVNNHSVAKFHALFSGSHLANEIFELLTNRPIIILRKSFSFLQNR